MGARGRLLERRQARLLDLGAKNNAQEIASPTERALRIKPKTAKPLIILFGPLLAASPTKRYVSQIDLAERTLFPRFGALTIFPLNFEEYGVWHEARRR